MTADTTTREAGVQSATLPTAAALPAVIEKPAHGVSAPTPAELTKQREGLLAMHLSVEQIELLKSTMMQGATDDEVAVFVYVCNRTGLDPFARQIYPVKRRSQVNGEWVERWVYQVAIDGFRLIAHRTKLYDGQLEPIFYDPAENERKVWLDTKPPTACKVGVMRKGVQHPIFATVLWREYVQTTRQGGVTAMWRDKPTVMLAKCAEAAALRKAFPQELSGLYIAEELMQDQPSDEVVREPVRETRAKVAEAAVEILNDNDVTLNFGRFVNRKASTLTLEECEKTFISAWQDPARKATAEQRMGAAAVRFILEHYEKLKAAAAQGDAPAKPTTTTAEAPVLSLPAWVVRIIEAKLKGQKIGDDAAEDFRNWMLDNPEPAALVKAKLKEGGVNA